MRIQWDKACEVRGTGPGHSSQFQPLRPVQLPPDWKPLGDRHGDCSIHRCISSIFRGPGHRGTSSLLSLVSKYLLCQALEPGHICWMNECFLPSPIPSARLNPGKGGASAKQVKYRGWSMGRAVRRPEKSWGSASWQPDFLRK